MAKRFTDTDKWKKNWFNNLSIQGKLIWFYVVDNCNHAGICDFSEKLFSYMLGFKVTKEILNTQLKNKISWIEEDKFFIVSFVEFQYGKLNENNRAHKSVLDILNKIKQAPYKPLISPLQGDKDKDKDMDKEEDKDKDIILKSPQYRISCLFWESIASSGTVMQKPDLELWAEEIEKIHRIDKRPWDLINITMQTARQDEFWIKILKSPKKLRDHLNSGKFDKFIPAEYRTDKQYIADLKIALEKENGQFQSV